MAQGIQIGDAVLKLFVDWTEINNIASDLPAKLKPGSDAAASVGKNLDAVGTSAATAGNQATAAGAKIASAGKVGAEAMKGADVSTQALITRVKSLEGESAKLRVEIQGLEVKLNEAGQQGQNAGRRMASGMYEARGEAALLGELTGVRLPRHVRSFLAELPGVGTALTAAFEATAVLFIIDAIIQLGEKIEAFREKPQRIADAWDKYRETVFQSGLQIRGEIDKEEQKLIEMAQGPVAALDFALKHLQSTAAETFKLITADIGDAVKAMQEQSGFGNVFGDASKDLQKFQNELQKVMRLAQEAHPDQPFVAYNAAVAAVQQKERDLTALIKQREAASGRSSEAATSGLHAEREAINAILPLLQKGIELDQLKEKAAKSDEQIAAAQQFAEIAKRNFDNRVAQINQEKADQQVAFNEGKIGAALWAKAQVEAAQKALDAQLQYKEALLIAARSSGEAVKIQAATQDLALEKTKQQTVATIALATAYGLVKQANAKLDESLIKTTTTQFQLGDEASKAYDKASESAKALGFTLSGDVFGSLEKAKKAFDDLKKSGDATYADILRGQMAVLKLQIELDREFGKDTIDEQKQLAKLGQEYDRLTGHITKADRGLIAFFKTLQKGDGLTKLFDRDLSSSSKGMQAFGSIAEGVAMEFGQAWETAIEGAILGQQSFGEALAAATAQVLAQISAQALVYALFYTAQGIADLFWNPGRAAADFEAAAEFYAVAAVAGIAAHAINPGRGSSGASGNNVAPSSIGENGQASQQPSQTQNSTHFGAGAVVTKRMRAVIGDSPSGGDQDEAVIPLEDSRATKRISDAILGPMIAAFSGFSPAQAATVIPHDVVADIVRPQPFTSGTIQAASEASNLSRRESTRAVQETHHHYESTHVHVEMPVSGVYSDSNIEKLAPKMAREISKQVSAGKTRLKSSTTYRVTKRG